MNYNEYVELVKDVKVPSTLEVREMVSDSDPNMFAFQIASLKETPDSIVKIPCYYKTPSSPLTLVYCLSDYVFKNQTQLTDVIIFQEFCTIPVFKGCSQLKNVVLPKSLESFDAETFLGCDQLENIYYEGTEEEWAAIKLTNVNGQIKYGPKVKGKLVVTFERNPYNSVNDIINNAQVHFNCDLSLINQKQ